MNISKEENLMYSAMKAIYESGIPVSFKGSMVLKAYLIEAGYANDVRHTVDIDANWNTDYAPTEEQMRESLEKALASADIDLNVKIYRKYDNGRSAGFELSDKSTDEILFTMDIDVNRPVLQTKIYEIADFQFRGVVPTQMIADKLSVISTDKIFRRIKDVIDLYYISNVFSIDINAIAKALENSGRTLGNFDGFLNRTDDLKHSYEKFRFAGDVAKPPFEEVYNTVKSYIFGFLQKSNVSTKERDGSTFVDSFYSENNMDHLRRGIAALNAGKGTPHEPIE